MNVLIVGKGGREHALGWKMRPSPALANLYFMPGNAGTAQIGTNIKFAPSYPRRKRFPRITSAGYEAGHRENFVGKARPTGRTIHYAAIHPRRQADGVFWPLPINVSILICLANYSKK